MAKEERRRNNKHTTHTKKHTNKHRTGQDRTGQDRTGQDRTGQDRTGQDRTGQDRTGQDRTGQDETRRDETRRDKTRQDKTRQDKHTHGAAPTRSQSNADSTGLENENCEPQLPPHPVVLCGSWKLESPEILENKMLKSVETALSKSEKKKPVK